MTVLEHLHHREGGVGEATDRVPAPLAGRERGGPVAGEVEGVDERHVVEPDVAGVVLLVVGEDDHPPVALRVEPAGDGGVAVGGVTDRADRPHHLVHAAEHRHAVEPLHERVRLAVDHDVDVRCPLGGGHGHDGGDLDALHRRAAGHRCLHRARRVDDHEGAVERRDVGDGELERATERALPVVRRRVLVRRPHLVREQPRLRPPASASVILAMTASIAGSEMPAWSKLRRFRTRAITPIDGMTASHASASMPPGSQPESRSHEKPASVSAAGPRRAQHDTTLVRRDGVELGGGRQHRQHVRRRPGRRRGDDGRAASGTAPTGGRRAATGGSAR